MSTIEKVEIVCGLPSSSTWKSSFFRSRTKLAWRSDTIASTSTYSTVVLKVGCCDPAGVGACAKRALAAAPRTTRRIGNGAANRTRRFNIMELSQTPPEGGQKALAIGRPPIIEQAILDGWPAPRPRQ